MKKGKEQHRRYKPYPLLKTATLLHVKLIISRHLSSYRRGYSTQQNSQKGKKAKKSKECDGQSPTVEVLMAAGRVFPHKNVARLREKFT